MKQVSLIVVGKLRETFWAQAADHFTSRLSRTMRVREIIVKDGNSRLSPADRNVEEGERILAALSPTDIPIALDEHGTLRTSVEFARFLDDQTLDGNRTPCFLVGGAFGLSPAVRAACRHTFSLSPMTFTHEMARVLLLEQLYRADAILRGSPYHHA